MTFIAWSSFESEALGEGASRLPQYLPILSNTKQIINPITSGIYGPFSSDYTMSLFFTSEGDSCWLVRQEVDFIVKCLPIQATSGVRLAQSDKSSIIQAHLGAVNSPTGKPIPEFVFIIPLADADMIQNFSEKQVIKRLLKATSIFDDICKLFYQVDEQPPVHEEWRCSSFLNFWDRYNGKSKFYYELRVRPVTLWPTDYNTTTTSVKENPDWFVFFNNLVDKKKLKVTVEINEETLTEVTLNLTSHPKLLNNLLTICYDNIPDSSSNTSAKKNTGWIIGPFNSLMCTEKRFAVLVELTGRKGWYYTGKFFVDCDRFKHAFEDLSKWLILLLENFDYERPANVICPEIIFGLQDFGYFPSIIISHSGILTQLPIRLTKMKPELLKSKLVLETLNGTISPELPCTVSFMINGRLVNSESYKCNLTSEIYSSDFVIVINVDDGFNECFLSGDLTCQKVTLKKAASFLKEIKNETDEIIIEIKFAEGEVMAAKLNLLSFMYGSIDEFLKCVDILSK